MYLYQTTEGDGLKPDDEGRLKVEVNWKSGTMHNIARHKLRVEGTVDGWGERLRPERDLHFYNFQRFISSYKAMY